MGALCSPLRSRGSNFRAEDRAAAPGMPHAEPLLHDGPGPAASGATRHEEPRVPQHVCRTVTCRWQRGWPALGPCSRALGGSVPPARAVRGGRALPLASRLSEPQDGRARPPGVRAHTLRPGGRGSPPPLAAGLRPRLAAAAPAQDASEVLPRTCARAGSGPADAGLERRPHTARCPPPTPAPAAEGGWARGKLLEPPRAVSPGRGPGTGLVYGLERAGHRRA